MTQRVSDDQVRILADGDYEPVVQIGIGTTINLAHLAADLLDARAIIAAYLAEAQPTSEAERLMPTEKRLVRRLMETLNIKTCRDHSCVYVTEPIKGMGTNGGCRCAGNVESAVFDLMQRMAKVCEAGEVLFGEVIDICDDPDCGDPRCLACVAMKSAIAAARAAKEAKP